MEVVNRELESVVHGPPVTPPRGVTLVLRAAPSWPLAVLFLSSLMSCGGEGSEVPPPDGMSVSSAPVPRTEVPRLAPTEVLRLAPDECPPSRLRGELWTEPDSVLLSEGLLLELQGCESDGDRWETYSYEGPAPVTPYHIVEVRYYEGVSWLLVNAEGRRWQVVRSRPLFSPDGAWFVTAWNDLQAGYVPSHLDIWAVEADSVRRVLALTGGLEWGAVDPRWVSSNRIEYLRVSRRAEPTSPMTFDTVATGVTRDDEGWAPDALPTSAR